ncbi:PLP-dependent aminotransferase family protein [Neobacillus sp. WH10]|uniref:aminotransferase-like domain-containing protein n=1 Tax=Neobacillus sp. WH10 TaxID=3047873 RepID=UPI0024C1A8A3|nr:PLP-dependent aminotransferase family protein [Neobacillus sp. WH10]WHY75436.1 PLP-dependent aminotransferase family protein [Neobacillus sp. WH10]
MKKYQEIVGLIEQQVTQGILVSGSKLPSIRALSKKYSCSHNTVIKAYQELENRHLIYSMPKSGYYIVEDFPLRERTDNKQGKIDFLSAGPDKQAMPYQDFKHCINQAIELYKEDMFTYSESQGLYSLRVELARHLQNLQVFTVPDRIFVVSGSQQALNLFVEMPFPNGKTNICVEQPTHPAFVESIQVQNANAFGIEITKQGVDMQRLEEIFKHQDIKFFYTTSRFHNPTGYSYSNKEKKKMVELAQKYDVYIIEDDYMGDLDFNLKQDPMFAYDPSGRVIYTKSFSKVLLPGLRLGLTVIPESMKSAFSQAKYAADLHTPVLTQGALEIYLKNGMFDAHIKKIRQIYREKGEILQTAYKKYLPAAASYTGSTSGFYSTIVLPHPLKAEQLINQLIMDDVDVDVDNAQKMYLPECKKENVIRLSVSQVENVSINNGIQKIAKAIMKLTTRLNVKI